MDKDKVLLTKSGVEKLEEERKFGYLRWAVKQDLESLKNYN